MKKLSRWLYTTYYNAINSIAFFPVLIAIGFFLFSFLIMFLEYKPLIIDFKKWIKFMLVGDKEDARLILGTVIGSIFSLMVFSFSMVMLVLNSASSALSPRVIPGLITKKAHQIVLGFYIGTIVYCFILIINIQGEAAEFQIPTLGVLVAMAFAIVCLGLFVYFIHSISKSIQVDAILDRIFRQSSAQMDSIEESDDEFEIPDTGGWHSIYSDKDGYLKRVNRSNLMSICEKEELKVALIHNPGFFVVKGYPILKVNKKLNKETMTDLRDCMVFYIEERVSDHYLFGLKQISEISVKAMSPGINDPGTAIKGIDMLTVLLTKKMRFNEKHVLTDDEGEPRVYLKIPTLEFLFFQNLIPIRNYSKNDVNVMINLLECLKNLAYADRDQLIYQPVIAKYIKSMADSCRQHISNEIETEQVNRMIDTINQLLGEDYRVDFGENEE